MTERHGARAPHIAGVCHGALARRAKSAGLVRCWRRLFRHGCVRGGSFHRHLKDVDMVGKPVGNSTGQPLGAEGPGPWTCRGLVPLL